MDFQLPKKIDTYLAALSRHYAKTGDQVLREVVVNGLYEITEGVEHDNWNGGVDGHAITFTVRDSVFMELFDGIDEYRTKLREDLNRLNSIQSEYVSAVFIEIQISEEVNWRQQSGIHKPSDSSLDFTHNSLERIWDQVGARVFISHKSTAKEQANDLKESLRSFGVAGFVAHEDIHPTEEWINEIERALFSMDAIVALLTEDYYESDWTDQEVGVAMGRRVPVIAVRLGKDPRGLMGKRQGVGGCSLDDTRGIAEKVYDLLVKRLQDNAILFENACKMYANAKSWSSSALILRTMFSSFNKVTVAQVDQIVKAFETNTQNRNSWAGQEILLVLLKKWTDKDWEVVGDKLVPKSAEVNDEFPF